MVERHLGLMPTGEVGDAERRLRDIADAVAGQVDLGAVRTLAANAPPGPAPAPFACAPATRPVRIGIARDEAFGFYYPDDLQALEAAGAVLLPIDTLRDAGLPALDGLLIGGGFPEAFMPQLEANATLRAAIRTALADGLPAYAECGGLMYLARSIRWQGRVARMVGAIPGDIEMRERPVGRGYVRVAETAAHPWPRSAGDVALDVPLLGHEFHHSALVDVDPGLQYAYTMQRGHGIDGRRDGVIVNRLLASYTHLRATGGNHWPERFVAFVRQAADARQAAGARPSTVDAQRPPRSPLQGALTCSV
jgi:cobyrinic acid a,c-diamide synthase